MPYINKTARNLVNDKIDDLLDVLVGEIPIDKLPGVVNYCITNIVLQSLTPQVGDWDYHSLSRALAVFSDAESEARIRLMRKVEDSAIIRNGDLDVFSVGEKGI
jgi:hypothetical protein